MRKKYKYFQWRDPNMGIGQAQALIYIEANSEEDNISFYTYSYKFDGIFFKEENGYHLIKSGF